MRHFLILGKTQKGELTTTFWYEDAPSQLDVLRDADVGFQTRRQLSVL